MREIWRLCILTVDGENVTVGPRVASVIEALFRERGIEDIVVDSAGVCIDPHLTDETARERYGTNRPTGLSVEMIAASNIVLATDKVTANLLKERFEVPNAIVLNLRRRKLSPRRGEANRYRAFLSRRLAPLVDGWANEIKDIKPSATWEAIAKSRRAGMNN